MQDTWFCVSSNESNHIVRPAHLFLWVDNNTTFSAG